MVTILNILGVIIAMIGGLLVLIVVVPVLAYLVAKMWTLGKRRAEQVFREKKGGPNGRSKKPPFGA